MATGSIGWEALPELVRRASAPASGFNQLAARNVERVARFQFELAGDWVQAVIDQVHAVAGARDFASLVTRQSAAATASLERVARRQQDLGRLVADVQSDAGRWFEESGSQGWARAIPGAVQDA